MRIFCLLMFLIVPLTGCQSRPEDRVSLPKPTLQDLKQSLTSVSETGEGGSSLGGVQAALEAIKGDQADLHQQLMPLFDQMNATEDPEEIKKLAKEMLGKLPE